MTDLPARAVSLFGEIAAQAGRFEAEMGFCPVYVLITPDQAKTLMDYYRTNAHPISEQTPRRTADRLVMVSGLEVHIIRGKGPLRVG